MKFTTKQLFSLFDGRLATSMDDVYKMLIHITGEDWLMTHHLPTSLKFIESKNLDWFQQGVQKLNSLKEELKTNDFNGLMEYYDKHEEFIDVPTMTEKEKEGFGPYMMENSLLKQLGKDVK